MPYALSAPCLTALNTSVSCPSGLIDLSVSGSAIDSDGVTALCTDTCKSSLQSARFVIAGACSATDIVVIDSTAYPATFFVDTYIFTYNLACRKDSQTGQYCDPQLASWADQGSLNSSQSCSDCWLGAQQLLLANPLGYDEGLADDFASLTSSCSAQKYSYTTPTTYALNDSSDAAPSTASASPTSIPGCTGSYYVQATDTCFSLSQYLNVSTYNLLVYNGWDMYCQNFNASVGHSFCSPPTCDTYTWQANDTCDAVTLANPSITLTQFMSWNPNFDPLCQNAGNFIGYEVCLSPPGGELVPTATSNLGGGVTVAPTTAAPVPTNAMDGSNRDCGRWYNIVAGDECGTLSVANGITLQDFYFLNPEINSQCTNLLLNISYCVQPVGDISSYANYTASGGVAQSITVPPNTFSSVNTAIATSTAVAGFDYQYTWLPQAPGTSDDCAWYANYSSSGLMDCTDVAEEYAITTDQLLSWNPSLSSDLGNCSLQSGYSYCVQTTSATVDPSRNDCTPINATTIMNGTSLNCDCFILLSSTYQSSYGCSEIESDYSVTDSDLLQWNTWLGSSCETNLYANLDDGGFRPLCVGVNASQPVGTIVSSASGTLSPTEVTTGGTTATISMGPTASGEVQGCLEYHTIVKGDTCYSIEVTYGISLAQLYAWNPSIGSDCSNLWLGSAYCVQGPAATATTSAAAAPAPTQSGIATNCNEYYVVADGDSCSKIETQYSVSFAQLYKWNPAIGDDCQALWPTYAICVGVSS
ncbi:hypothetical protein KCU99_g6485, partial [Aureobasidium melanogenum]